MNKKLTVIVATYNKGLMKIANEILKASVIACSRIKGESLKIIRRIVETGIGRYAGIKSIC